MRLLRPLASAAALVGTVSLLACQGSVVVAQSVPSSSCTDGPLPTLTGGGVMSSLYTYMVPSEAIQQGATKDPSSSTSMSSRWSFPKWRRRSAAATHKKRTPWFIPAEMMREEPAAQQEEVQEEEQETLVKTLAPVAEEEEEKGGESFVSFSMTEEEVVDEEIITTTTTTTSFGGGSLEDLSSDNADLLMGAGTEEALDEDTIQEEEQAEEEEAPAPLPPPPPPAPRASFLKPRVKVAAKKSSSSSDDDDSIPCGRSLSSALSVIGGGLPLRRGGSDAASMTISTMTTTHSSSKKVTATATASTHTNKSDAEETAVQITQQQQQATFSTSSSSALPAGVVLGEADADAARDAELARIFHAETARQVAALSPEQKAGLDRVREALYGPTVDPKRVVAVDQLVVCDDREAMLLAFLSRKNFDVELALRSFDRVIAWRLENDIENVFHESRLAKEKIDKHRECWPTAFYYTHDHAGDPVFVDRMGILELSQIRKGPVALDLKDMVNYYIQTMEGRRRLLFPQLSRKSGRLVTSYVSVVDVSRFGPQHFGRHALQFMKALGDVHDENYSDLCKSLYIINAPFFFHKVFHLISCMMSQELKDRLKVLNKKESLVELSKILPAEVAEAIVEGDHARERAEERQLHEFLDAAAKAGHHKRRWLL